MNPMHKLIKTVFELKGIPLTAAASAAGVQVDLLNAYLAGSDVRGLISDRAFAAILATAGVSKQGHFVEGRVHVLHANRKTDLSVLSQLMGRSLMARYRRRGSWASTSHQAIYVIQSESVGATCLLIRKEAPFSHSFNPSSVGKCEWAHAPRGAVVVSPVVYENLLNGTISEAEIDEMVLGNTPSWREIEIAVRSGNISRARLMEMIRLEVEATRAASESEEPILTDAVAVGDIDPPPSFDGVLSAISDQCEVEDAVAEQAEPVPDKRGRVVALSVFANRKKAA